MAVNVTAQTTRLRKDTICIERGRDRRGTRRFKIIAGIASGMETEEIEDIAFVDEISLSGVSLTMNRPVGEGERVFLSLCLPGSMEVVKMEGYIVSCEEIKVSDTSPVYRAEAVPRSLDERGRRVLFKFLMSAS